MTQEGYHGIAFVTNDRWLREHGKMDPTDEEIIQEASEKGPLVMMSFREALESMEHDIPDKYKDFRSTMDRMAGRALSTDELIKLSSQADIRKMEFDGYTNLLMTKRQAAQVRAWRVDAHYTWRAVARAAFGMVASNKWGNWKLWYPPSNQLMGKALSDRAAEILGEDFLEPPWN